MTDILSSDEEETLVICSEDDFSTEENLYVSKRTLLNKIAERNKLTGIVTTWPFDQYACKPMYTCTELDQFYSIDRYTRHLSRDPIPTPEQVFRLPGKYCVWPSMRAFNNFKETHCNWGVSPTKEQLKVARAIYRSHSYQSKQYQVRRKRQLKKIYPLIMMKFHNLPAPKMRVSDGRMIEMKFMMSAVARLICEFTY